MSPSLAWFAAPLLLVPFLVAREHLGGAGGRIIIAGLGFAALHQGAGTLDVGDLVAMVRQTPGDAWFIGLTAGLIISGACLFPLDRDWRQLLAGLPLALAAIVIGIAAPVPLIVGAAIGCVPSIAGRATRHRLVPGVIAASGHVGRATALLGALTVACALAGPVLGTMVLLCGLLWVDARTVRGSGSTERERAARRRARIRAAFATVFLAGWTWFALTIAGSVTITLNAFRADAPVSAAASQWLALLAIGWGVMIAAPWPIDDDSGAEVRLPVLAIVLYLAAARAAADGVAHWQPLVTVVLVPLALLGVACRRWSGAAGAMVLLAAMRPGTMSIVAALAVALIPAGAAVVRSHRIRAAMLGVIGAAVVAVVLTDQVLLGVVLAIGLAATANRADRVVAPA